MQEKLKKKKKSTKKFSERERELFFFVRENYAQNRRDSDKFIIRWCE